MEHPWRVLRLVAGHALQPQLGARARQFGAVILSAMALAGCLKPSGQHLQIDAQVEMTPTGSDSARSHETLPEPPLAAQHAEAPPPMPEANPAPAASARMLALPPHLRPAAGEPSPATTGALHAHAPAPSPLAKAGTIRLADAVASAVMSYPEIRINEARAREAAAGIGIARAALFPVADLRLAVGMNMSGSYTGDTIPYKTATNAVDGRFDGGVILRQLVYDFGATRSDVERAELLRDAEKLKLREKIDDIAFRTSQSYLKVLEQRALLGLVDDIIGAHEQLARVVQAHAREGHGTLADVQRVNSRLIDVRSIRTDVSLQIKAAEDQFERLTRAPPRTLANPPDVRAALPRTPEAAIGAMLAGNPRLAALQSSTQSSRKELETQKLSNLPRINLEVESESKNFRNGPAGRTQAEARAMLAMRYRIMDGGLSAATQQQILARIDGGEASYLNEREQLEADIRQAYRAIESAGRKLRLVSEGVGSARQVRELYLEQFKGGKRTVFELLDSQMSFFTVRRSQIESRFEGQRAMFDILRATGALTQTLSRRS